MLNFDQYFMHFLSHYYYELPAKSPLFIAGLCIPDLTHGFSKAYNSSIKKSVLNNNELVKQVQLGVLKHYEADKMFHNSPLFIKLVAESIQSFLKEGLSRERLRLSVIAHLAVELMIDRQILIENRQLCVDFYNQLSMADEGVINSFFDVYLSGDKKKDFLIRFQFFKQRRFIFLFGEIENIVQGLSRIYHNTTGVEFTEDEKHNFFNALNNIDPTIRYSWKEILNAKVYE